MKKLDMVSHQKNINSKKELPATQGAGQKGKKSFAARFQKFLDEKITVNINGRPEKLTKEDAFLKRVINDAIAGKPGATNQLISLKQMVSAMPNTEGMSASERNKLDQALLESFMQLLGPDWKSKLEGG